MLNVSSEEKAKFVLWIRSQGVTESLVAPYVRWMCYYLDYCQKYHFAANHQESLAHFLNKLEDKGQTKEQQQQAAQAIALYRGLKFPGGVDNDGTQTSPPAPEEKGGSASAAGASPLLMATAEPTLPIAVAPTLAKPQTGVSWKAEFSALVDAIRLRHYSPKTLKTYKLWMRKFQAFTRSKPPQSLTPDDVKEFLTWLAVKREVSASTQNQAFNALLFLFRHVLHQEFGKVEGVVRAKRKPYIPVVLPRDEVTEVVSHLDPPFDLVVKLLYGCGLRLAECLHLRVQCLNFDAGVITVHDGKGQKDRTVPLPAKLVPELRDRLRLLIRVNASL